MALGTEDLYQELMARLRGQPSSGAPAANDFAPPADPNAALRALQEQEKRPAQPQAQRSPISVSLGEGGETLGGPRAGGMAALGGESAADEGTSALAGALTPSSGSAQYGGSAISIADKSLPPEAQALLATIGGPDESGGRYNVNYGGTNFSSFADHPRQMISAGGYTSDAAGRYQFLSTTWDQERAKLGLKDFSPENQDKAAWDLAQTTYRQNTGGDLAAALRSGDPQTLNGVASALKGVWPSLPGGSQQGSNAGTFGSRYGQNLSAFTGRSGGADVKNDIKIVNGVPYHLDGRPYSQQEIDASTKNPTQAPLDTYKRYASETNAASQQSAPKPAAPQQSTQQRLASDLMKLDPSMTPDKAAFAAGMAIKSGTIDPNDYEGSVSRMKTLYNNLPDTAKAAIRSQMDEGLKQQQSAPKPQSQLTQPSQSQLNKTVGYVDPSRSTPTTPNNFAGMSTSPVGYAQAGSSSGPQAAAPTPSIGYVQPTAADASEEFADT